MGEKKTRVTRLARVKEQLEILRMRVIGRKTTAAQRGEFAEAITHQEDELFLDQCIEICNKRVRHG